MCKKKEMIRSELDPFLIAPNQTKDKELQFFFGGKRKKSMPKEGIIKNVHIEFGWDKRRKRESIFLSNGLPSIPTLISVRVVSAYALSGSFVYSSIEMNSQNGNR